MVFFLDQFLEQALVHHNTCTSMEKEAAQAGGKNGQEHSPNRNIYLTQIEWLPVRENTCKTSRYKLLEFFKMSEVDTGSSELSKSALKYSYSI